jgi:hypothetical protein
VTKKTAHLGLRKKKNRFVQRFPRVAKAQKAAKAKAVKVRGQAGTLDDLKACLWLAVTKCTMAIYQQGPLNDEGRKSIFCLSQISSVYIRAVEATDLESRIQVLEEGR